MAKYTTVQGDTWDMIAYRRMGSEKLMDQLIDSNSEHRNIVFFSAGVVLEIPEIASPITINPVPPWQK